MRAAVLACCAALLLLTGCAGAPKAEAPPEPVRFAVLTSPAVGGDDPTAEWPAEALLLEAVTQLSAETQLDFVLVSGPVLAEASAEARDALVGALGSLAAPVVVALAPGDLAAPDLLEALEAVAGHAGRAAYARTPRPGWRVVAVGPGGAVPAAPATEGDAAPPRTVLTSAAGVEAPEPALASVALAVRPGPAPALERAESGRLRLVLPPLTAPPHLFALVEVSPGGTVSLELRSVSGDAAPPPPPSALLPR